MAADDHQQDLKLDGLNCNREDQYICALLYSLFTIFIQLSNHLKVFRLIFGVMVLCCQVSCITYARRFFAVFVFGCDGEGSNTKESENEPANDLKESGPPGVE